MSPRARAISFPNWREPVKASTVSILIARGVTAILLILSSIGLLSVPVGEYDDSVLLLGARLALAGKVPYVDFYANYGPLGYTLVAVLLREVERPALALRIGQIVFLAALAILGHWVARRRDETNGGENELVVPLAVLGLSMPAIFPSFFGFAFATAALLFFAEARRSNSSAGGWVLAVLGGAALAFATLTRPAFGAYVGGAAALAQAIRMTSRSEGRGGEKTTMALFFASMFLGIVLVWLLVYREIPVRVAFDAAVKGPTYLVRGERYLEPTFLRLPVLEAFAGGCAIAGASLIWGFALPNRRGRNLVGFLFVALGLLPVLSRAVIAERPLFWLGILLFPVTALVALIERRALAESPDIAAAALVGLASAAFGHYAWTRPDAPHLLPALALGAIAVSLVWRRIPFWQKLGVIGLFVFGFHLAAKGWYWKVLPIGRLSTTEFSRWGPWGCEEVDPDAAKAVALADRRADPASRFVAVASSHVSSQGNPVLLFLLSQRLPYTRWFHYDPGVQSSASIQQEMERELVASGSRTAVVWRAERFVFDRKKIPAGAISPFDEFFDRLYPASIGRFGDYEVRAREPFPGGGATSRPPADRASAATLP